MLAFIANFVVSFNKEAFSQAIMKCRIINNSDLIQYKKLYGTRKKEWEKEREKLGVRIEDRERI
jgi:hypothetical protein